MNNWRWREEDHRQTPNRLQNRRPGNDPAVLEALQLQDAPSLASQLGISDMLIDPMNAMKVYGIEQFIQDLIEQEGMRRGIEGYRTVMDRMAATLPMPMEFMMKNGEGLKVLDHFFAYVAIRAKMSSKSYLKKVEREFKLNKINPLTAMLQRELVRI